MMKILLLTLFLLAPFSIEAAENQIDSILAQGGTGLKINDIRSFDIDENTILLQDGLIIPVIDAQGGTGYKLRYSVANTSPNLLSGTLEEVDLINIYKGPLLSVSPLKVFNINGLVNANTYYANVISPDDLQAGDSIQVSGFVDNTSVSIITRIEKVDSLNQWKLSGFVENLTSTQFSINEQIIDYLPSNIGSCNANLADGVFVEILATPTVGFQLNDTLSTVTEINCLDRSVNPGVAATVIVEGMIDALLSGDDFVLAGQTVEANQSTKYIRGGIEDVQERVKVEVVGSLNEMTGVIVADKVRFLEARINLTIPVEMVDVNLPEFQVAGVNLTVTPETLDPDGVLTNGLSEATQLQFRGYGFDVGELVITRLNIRGSVNYDDVAIEGYITEINPPQIEIFGVIVDTSLTDFIDENGLVINAVDFFNQVLIGSKVSLDVGSYDNITEVITGGTLTIDDLIENLSSQSSDQGSGNAVYGVGTITGLSDLIFSDSFE